MCRAKQIFSSLLGVWRFTRSIVHKIPKEQYEGRGCATFSLLGQQTDSLEYYEKVRLQNQATQAEIKGYQAYLYSYSQQHNEIAKYFKDARLFYKLPMGKPECIGHHICGEDNYKATYHFKNHDRFILVYEVLGPRKNYTIHTEYTRSAELES